MIRVLIVDDDKLVRLGLISTIPWAEFDMKVVGEARNGEKALEFLETHEVDLLVTDLAMPSMSGIELMRIVQVRYPDIHLVVLTLHQDFEYVQEALQLGAIDYIAKVELEEGAYREVPRRIYNRIQKKRISTGPADFRELPSRVFTSDSGYAVLFTREHHDEELIYRSINPVQWHLSKIDRHMWFLLPTSDKSFHQKLLDVLGPLHEQSGWMCLQLEGLEGKDRNTVTQLLRNYYQGDFFYEFDDKTVIRKSIQEFFHKPMDVNHQDIDSLLERWLAFDWVHKDTLFLQLRDELKERKLPIPRLHQLLYGIAVEWNRIYGTMTSSRVDVLETFENWRSVNRWLEHSRDKVIQAAAKPHYSQEISKSVMAAVRIVQGELNQPLTAIDVAKRVSMSRSYFNKCFKGIVGRSFNEYLRQVRIEKAKFYLVQTNKQIQWIAEHTGYMDEKYFSQIFRELTGMTPTDYRQKHRSG